MRRDYWVLLIWVLWVAVLALYYYEGSWGEFGSDCSARYPEGWRVGFVNGCPGETFKCSVPVCYSVFVEELYDGGVV